MLTRDHIKEYDGACLNDTYSMASINYFDSKKSKTKGKICVPDLRLLVFIYCKTHFKMSNKYFA